MFLFDTGALADGPRRQAADTCLFQLVGHESLVIVKVACRTTEMEAGSVVDGHQNDSLICESRGMARVPLTALDVVALIVPEHPQK